MMQSKTQEHPSQTLDSIFDNLIRTIGGKKIRTFTMLCYGDDDFTSLDTMGATTQNAILLKKSDKIHVLNYSSKECSPVFSMPKQAIDSMFFYQSEPKEYELMVRSGLNWHLHIVLA